MPLNGSHGPWPWAELAPTGVLKFSALGDQRRSTGVGCWSHDRHGTAASSWPWSRSRSSWCCVRFQRC